MNQKRDFALRVAVGTKTGPQSSVWIIWSRRDEVYAAHRARAGTEKFSFHSSGICRQAFTAEYGRPPSVDDRAIQKWTRAPTPPAGLGQRSRVLSVVTPTDTLSSVKPRDVPDKINWLPPRALSATIFEVGFTNEREDVAIEAFRAVPDETLLAYHRLPCGEAVIISAGHSSWLEPNFTIPAGEHEVRDAVIANVDPHATGRPLRVSLLGTARDGEVLMCWEFGAFYAAPNDPVIAALNINRRFDRKKVIATQATVPLPWSPPRRT